MADLLAPSVCFSVDIKAVSFRKQQPRCRSAVSHFLRVGWPKQIPQQRTQATLFLSFSIASTATQGFSVIYLTRHTTAEATRDAKIGELLTWCFEASSFFLFEERFLQLISAFYLNPFTQRNAFSV